MRCLSVISSIIYLMSAGSCLATVPTDLLPESANPHYFKRNANLDAAPVIKMVLGDSVDVAARDMRIPSVTLMACRDKAVNTLMDPDVSDSIARWGANFVADPVGTANTTDGIAGDLLRQSAIIVDAITDQAGPPLISCMTAVSHGAGSRECKNMVDPIRRAAVGTMLKSAAMSTSIWASVRKNCQSR